MHYCVCDYLSDIAENSFDAAATKVVVEIEETAELIEITVIDNGKGMKKEILQNVIDPFYSSKKERRSRKVGLGLPFLKQTTELAGGRFFIESEENKGTKVFFSFDKNNIDTPPWGDLPGCFLTMLVFAVEGKELLIDRRYAGEAYQVSRSELNEALGDLSEAGALALAKKYLISLEEEIKNKLRETEE